jgi:hypothetical protein
MTDNTHAQIAAHPWLSQQDYEVEIAPDGTPIVRVFGVPFHEIPWGTVKLTGCRVIYHTDAP